MPRTHDEDLFQSSTMTLGEHLEELRTCLIRAAAGFVVALVFGFVLARGVVHLIEQPLRRSLERYYGAQAIELTKQWSPAEHGGRQLPYSTAEVEDAVRSGWSFEVREVHVDRLPGATGDGLVLPPAPTGMATMPAAMTGSATPTSAAFDAPGLAPVVLWMPMTRDPRVSITTLSQQEAFGIWVRTALLVGIVLSSPWIFYQIWTFVAAGLYAHERRWVWMFLPFSIGLFLAGVFLAFFFVFDFVLDYLLQFNQWLGLDPDPRITEWLSFVLILPLGFGIGFQLPLVMLFLERIGVVERETYTSHWRFAVLAIAIVSAVLTPADPYSMLFLALPLCLLYFGGIALCRWFGAADAPERRQLATKASQ
jgi:sec-independent protein translocase protein TatC